MESVPLLAAANPLGHVVDRPLLEVGGVTIVTMHMVTMLVVSGLLVWTMLTAAKAIGTGPDSQGNERYLTKGRFAQMIESIVVYLRENMVRPQLGEATDRFLPYLLTLFFFILYNNIFGLIPLLDIQHVLGWALFNDAHWAVIGGTATGNIAVTLGLALIAFAIIQVNGIRSSGLAGWAKHFTAGAPLYMAPLMIPVEIMGMIIKPVALCVRLFANIVAGHTLLATLMFFTKMGLEGLGWLGGGAISIVAVLSALPIMFLEIFVAFLQAFIFFLLTTVFIAQLMHHDHAEHEHDIDAAHPEPPLTERRPNVIVAH